MIPSQDFKEFLKHEQRNWRDEGDKIIEGQRDEQRDSINEKNEYHNLPACPGHIGDKRAFEEGAKAELNHIIQILCGNKIESKEELTRIILDEAYGELNKIGEILTFAYKNNTVRILTEISDELLMLRRKFKIELGKIIS